MKIAEYTEFLQSRNIDCDIIKAALENVAYFEKYLKNRD